MALRFVLLQNTLKLPTTAEVHVIQKCVKLKQSQYKQIKKIRPVFKAKFHKTCKHKNLLSMKFLP